MGLPVYRSGLCNSKDTLSNSEVRRGLYCGSKCSLFVLQWVVQDWKKVLIQLLPNRSGRKWKILWKSQHCFLRVAEPSVIGLQCYWNLTGSVGDVIVWRLCLPHFIAQYLIEGGLECIFKSFLKKKKSAVWKWIFSNNLWLFLLSEKLFPVTSNEFWTN